MYWQNTGLTILCFVNMTPAMFLVHTTAVWNIFYVSIFSSLLANFERMLTLLLQLSVLVYKTR